jgi:D-alanyl-D-alanine carboxypeptidase
MERRTDPKRSARLDEFVVRKRRLTPGLAIAVVRDGAPVHLAGYGYANLDTRELITPRTRFHMASAGKQFTGLGVMMLNEAKALRYDDHIGDHVPELAGFPKSVTIRRLLHHLSGVNDFYGTPLENRLLKLSRHPLNRHVVRLYAGLHHRMDRKTIGRYVYNNTGYDLLGCVIERVAGESFREFFRKRVFVPLRMNDTFSLPAPLAGERIATSYEKKYGSFKQQSGSALDGICGSGSIYSTVSDLCRYEAALAAYRLVSPDTFREALTSAKNDNGKRINYGFGWRIARGFTWHSGEWAGFASHIRRYHDRRLSIYVLANCPHPDPEKIAEEAARAFS